MTLMTVLKRKNVNRDGANLDDTFVLENEKETTEMFYEEKDNDFGSKYSSASGN